MQGEFVSSPEPSVSVIVANFNGASFLSDALLSALEQTLNDIEIIVVDDASTDGSLEIAERIARDDSRVRVLARKHRSGPGSARNDGLAAARGRWIAILDSDDKMHRSRLEQLVREAESSQADICADDLMVFSEGASPTRFLSARQRKLGWISAPEFIASNKLFAREPSLGYLKPLIRADFLRGHGISYNSDLQIGEDYDLVVQLLAKGARFRLLETSGYFYRKHGHSISHRLSGAHVDHMRAADVRLRALFAKDAADVARAFDERGASLDRAAAFSSIVSALKARRWREACTQALETPLAVPLLALPIAARLRRLGGGRTTSAPSR